jgi:hypothetical protein
MVRDVAFEVVHEMDGAPLPTNVVGVAVSVHVGAGGGVTVIVSLQVPCPPGPVTVIVYFVVTLGCGTDWEPLSGTSPMPLSMVASTASTVVQERLA